MNWQRVDEGTVFLHTRTWGNPTIVTPATQGICLTILGSDHTLIQGRINGQDIQVPLGELRHGSRVGYLGGFLSPAYSFHRAVPQSAYTCRTSLLHRGEGTRWDWYYVRVCQKNGQWAWTSPIWVEGG
jgi:hypothetical protein